MTNEYSVVALEKMFLKDLNSLWAERFEDLPKRRILFEWLTSGNPCNLKNCYFLLLHRRKVIGMHGHMPLQFHVNGRECMGYLAHDDLLAMDYRGKGLGKVLLEGVAKQASEFSGALWFNEPNYKLYKKCSWTDSTGFYAYLKIFDPGLLVKRQFSNKVIQKIVSLGGKIILSAREILKNENLSSAVNIFRIERFDEQFDKFFEKISDHFGFIVARSEKYLNWKFVEKPFNNYRIFAALDKTNQLSGYMVLKSEKYGEGVRGKILDILVHPEKPQVFNALIYASIREFIGIRASHIEIVCTYPTFVKWLKKMGFIKKPNPLRFMVSNWEGQFDRDLIGNIDNWYLTFGDADGDAWTVDFADTWQTL